MLYAFETGAVFYFHQTLFERDNWAKNQERDNWAKNQKLA